MTRTVDYFFSVGSPWSYIGFDAFVELAGKSGVEIKPYLTTVVEENGGIFSRNRPEIRRNYWTRDLKRWARVRGKDLILENRPELSDPAPASLIIIAAYLDGKDWIALTRALQHAFWSEAKDIGHPNVRAAVADAAGFDGAGLLQRQADADVRAKWAADRDHAIKSGIFGFPTFLYEAETYWGQDNLPFLERHFAGNRP